MPDSAPNNNDSIKHWRCPWCGREPQKTANLFLLDSRACDCGAVAIAGPQIDSDEIIDAAIDYFRVTTRPESCGYDALLLQDIRRSGIEIREGMVTQDTDAPPPWAAIRHLWFRREKADDLDSENRRETI